MSLRRSSRLNVASTRKQKQYRIESDSESDDDDDETEMEASYTPQFGGVLAILKNDQNSTKKNRNSVTGRINGKNKMITSPPLKKTTREKGELTIDENGITPPPKSVTMTRSEMRTISPLTAQKEHRRRGGSKTMQHAKENSRADSVDGSVDGDDETHHQTLSNLEEKSESLESDNTEEGEDDDDDDDDDGEEEDYEDSFEASESSSEFEFGADDEEFIPDEDDEDDDESASMSDYIVDDDAFDDLSQRNSPSETPASKSDFNSDCIDADNTLDEESIFEGQNTFQETCDESCPDDSTVKAQKTPIKASDDTSQRNSPSKTPASKSDFNSDCIDADNTLDEESIYDGQNTFQETCDESCPDDSTVKAQKTPIKAGLPRKTLDFSSPEPQIAMMVDDDDVIDEADILVATIVDSDTVDGDTIVLIFDEDEQNDLEENESTLVQNHDQKPSKESTRSNRKTAMPRTVGSNDCQSQSSSSSTHRTRVSSQDSEKKSRKERQNKPNSFQEIEPVAEKTSNKNKSKKHYRQEGAIKRGKWALGAKIGVGSFGEVHIGMNTQTGVLMAVKKFRMEGAIMKDIRTEVELMRSLKHVNIVRYLGAQMDNEFLHIFQEWVPGGSVASLLHKFGSFSIEVIQSYISQTLSGLRYLHENNIMHRDIKGSNILVNDEGVVKVADFGASKKLKNLSDDMMMSLTVRGTPYFMAPEVFEERYSSKADIWGIGCVAFQMATANPPWKELGFTNPISLFNHMKRHKGPPEMKHPQKESFSKQQELSWNLFTKFVCKCFEYDPLQRPSAKELQNDPFFSSPVDSNGEDDESTHFRGLFSPGNESKKSFSPKQFSSRGKHPSPAQNSSRPQTNGRQELAFLSPPLPKKSKEIKKAPLANCDTPPRQPESQYSPSPDAREWPAWARSELEKQNECKVTEAKETTHGKLSELMDSLALSADSSQTNQPTSKERRSSSLNSSTSNTNYLIGFNFLETTRTNEST